LIEVFWSMLPCAAAVIQMGRLKHRNQGLISLNVSNLPPFQHIQQICRELIFELIVAEKGLMHIAGKF